VVSVVFRDGRRLDEPERIDLAEERGLKISRPVPAPDHAVGVMDAF
jgi:hypothetical protein